MIRPEIPLMQNCSSNLQNVFHNILTVVLLDVKQQFTCGNINPTIENLQNVLETSITTKFQEDGFLSVHLKDLEHSVAEYSMYEENLVNEKTVLESKLRETQNKYDLDIKSKINVIENLKKELRDKENVLKDSIKSYDSFKKSNKDVFVAKEMAEKLELENKHLKHKLKCVECKFDALKRSVLDGKEKTLHKDESKPEAKLLITKDENPEKSILIEEVLDEKERNVGNEKSNEKEINMMEDTLNLSTLNTQVELLMEQIDQLNSKKMQVEDDIDVKEGKIISLQSTIDKMKIIILQCKTKEHNLSLQLEYANVTIDKLQRTIGSLKKENEDVYKDVHRNNLKSTYIENQWDRIVTMSNKKNDKIETLQEEKNSLQQKIKEKNELISDKDVEHDKVRSEIDHVKQKYTKLCKSFEKLKKTYSDLEKHTSLFQKEREVMQQELMEKESANEIKISRLLKQLNVSKEEFKNEFIKSNEGVDISDIAEKIINKHRHDLSSLKTNMCWMKEALEVSEKDRLEMEGLLSQRDDELVKVQAKLSLFEDTNKQLSTSLVMQQSDTASIQKVLYNAMTSYDGVCSLFEMQEKELAKERDSYHSEIMDLQEKLKRKNGAKSGSRFYPSKSGVQFSEDLRFILGNIKDQLSSTLNNMSSRQEFELTKLSNMTPNQVQTFIDSQTFAEVSGNEVEESGNEMIENTTVNNSHLNSSRESDSNMSIGSNTQKLNEYLQMHTSVVHHSGLTQTSFLGNNYEKTLAEQSKSSLYSSYRRMNSFDKDQSVMSVMSDLTMSSNGNQNSTYGSVQSVVENTSVVKPNSDNNAVLKLQEKLSQLHQMGTNLKTNNSELTEMMKTHSKKLKMLKNKATDSK